MNFSPHRGHPIDNILFSSLFSSLYLLFLFSAFIFSVFPPRCQSLPTSTSQPPSIQLSRNSFSVFFHSQPPIPQLYSFYYSLPPIPPPPEPPPPGTDGRVYCRDEGRRSISTNAPREGLARTQASIQQTDLVGTCRGVAGTRQSAEADATDDPDGSAAEESDSM